ncbi:hypothetical protein CHL67_02565 [Prosthecochloris sp. GSB1]|uniref:O-antigen ligase family protein n=1 Tax=Prosthecochloris sp. GSB1 TaxID=281093 RepID=UPI000B8CEE78|nr:O-antigen ligase family protein [Prosthecochloris sp. GSB1]ASQ89951.1 hypothetical protein CHL67_02565 [Prosthecochloris sp. GSB1]
MRDGNFYWFYRAVFYTVLPPYISDVVPFIPEGFGGFNMTGLSWMGMLLLCCLFFLLEVGRKKTFPVGFWAPWLLYIVLYLVVDFSLPGLQLTLQYLLPFGIGIIASGFTYDREKLHWLFRQLLIVSMIVVSLFYYGHLFRGGWTPYTSSGPMLLSILAALSVGIFFMTWKIRFLLLYLVCFSVPILDVTRMGLAVFVVILVLHFANRKLLSKIAIGFAGAAMALAVFYSDAFQEKTFYGGQGSLSDLSINYYDEDSAMNTSGRTTFYKYYEPGLKASPIWGNGPRADMYLLKAVWGGEGISEAHNDYLSIQYNYGIVGVVFFAAGIALTFFSLYFKSRKEREPYRFLVVTSAMILIIGLLMFMYSDNILKYTIFFPNIFFALLGAAFAGFDKNQT